MLDKLLNLLKVAIPTVPIYVGYPPADQPTPYIVVRPISLTTGNVAVAGQSFQTTSLVGAYCVTNSAATSWALAYDVRRACDGTYLGESTLMADVSYSGALQEGAYESLVSIGLTEGN